MTQPRRDQDFLDLDQRPQDGLTLVLRYRGVVVSLTKERLVQLLEREERFLEQSVSGRERPLSRSTGSPAPVEERGFERGVRELATSDAGSAGLENGVSHGSLSGRIKKIYNYSLASRTLRPMHAGFLAELLRSFDWEMPEHPRTTLATYLGEIQRWKGVPPELARDIKRFLERYLAAVGDPKP